MSDLRARNELMAKELSMAYRLLENLAVGQAEFRRTSCPSPAPPLPKTVRAIYHVDRWTINPSNVEIEGWVLDPEDMSNLTGRKALLIRTPANGWLLFPALTVVRCDLIGHFSSTLGDASGIDQSGFCAVVPRWWWTEPTTEFRIVIHGPSGVLASTPIISRVLS